MSDKEPNIEVEYEDNLDEVTSSASKSSGWRKYVGRILTILFIIFTAMFVTGQYLQWKGKQDVEDVKQALDDYYLGLQEQAEADKAGGQTPKETLRMYIEAVEEGDYEQASDYFTMGSKEEALEQLQAWDNNDAITTILNSLEKSLEERGNYSNEDTQFYLNEPTYIRFIIYPSGNWKISEI